MDVTYYDALLTVIAKTLYGTKITFDERGIFEWPLREDGSVSHRSIKELHLFENTEKKQKPATTTQTKTVCYVSFENCIYITQVTEQSTVDIYSSGGGMTKRYTFKVSGLNVEKTAEHLISIR